MFRIYVTFQGKWLILLKFEPRYFICTLRLTASKIKAKKLQLIVFECTFFITIMRKEWSKTEKLYTNLCITNFSESVFSSQWEFLTTNYFQKFYIAYMRKICFILNSGEVALTESQNCLAA